MHRVDAITVGRSRGNDLVLTDPSVSARHARLRLDGDALVVEDLGSANGTFHEGRRVEGPTRLTPGAALRFGDQPCPWDHPLLVGWLRRRDPAALTEGTTLPGRRFICGACGTRGVMPPGFHGGPLRCGACRTRLVVGPPARRPLATGLAIAAAVAVALGLAGWALARGGGAWLERVRGLAPPAVSWATAPRAEAVAAPPPATPEEASIRAHTVERVVGALEPTHPRIRTEAVRVAAGHAGAYGVEQVAELFRHVRARWRYVSDPDGVDYFATASETLETSLAGDCDDFAILLSSMVSAIGGRARLVMMDGPQGGHAYAEACVPGDPADVAARLAAFVRRLPPGERGVGLRDIHFRSSPDCAVWLNLDWNARTPGGPYEPETWAVAIYPDGRTETLAPAPGPTAPVP